MTAPADKSVSQRAVMLAALAQGTTVIRRFLSCEDCHHAISAFSRMRVEIEQRTEADGSVTVRVQGNGLRGLQPPSQPLYLGNSGTTARLLTGILSGQSFPSELNGDESLTARPMQRILLPLRAMGAQITARTDRNQEYLPLQIAPARLQPMDYSMPLHSAQVKSCILLAGLFADGTTWVRESIKTRDHSERMLRLFGADLVEEGLSVRISGAKELVSPAELLVPGDISSAAFFLVAASIVEHSDIIIRNVGVNPTRAHILQILQRMGADLSIQPTAASEAGEPAADIRVRTAALQATDIDAAEVAYCIDELPILCVAASRAHGTTRILGAAELRVKETDRIHSMVTNLRKLGVCIDVNGHDLTITGPNLIQGGTVDSFGDHRTAMCMAVSGLVAEAPVVITGWSSVKKSYPGFSTTLSGLVAGV